jgi:hypothetical protein
MVLKSILNPMRADAMRDRHTVYLDRMIVRGDTLYGTAIADAGMHHALPSFIIMTRQPSPRLSTPAKSDSAEYVRFCRGPMFRTHAAEKFDAFLARTDGVISYSFRRRAFRRTISRREQKMS